MVSRNCRKFCEIEGQNITLTRKLDDRNDDNIVGPPGQITLHALRRVALQRSRLANIVLYA
jgi:hypothetical protein